MSIDDKVNELKKEIDLMKLCYNKGFGNALFGIELFCGLYLKNLTNPQHKEIALNSLERIETHYKSIPFDEIAVSSDFAPLFVCKELLTKYAAEVRDFFSNPNQKTLENISEMNTTLATVGRIYHAKFKQKIKELQQYKGYEDFKVRVTDYNGHTFII